jgi:NADPH2:quinone reductase
VTGTVSNAVKEQIVRTLGADFVVNSLKDNVADAVWEYTQGVGADLILDSSGGTSVKESIGMVARFGTVICFGATGGEPEAIPPPLLIKKSARLAGGHFVHL